MFKLIYLLTSFCFPFVHTKSPSDTLISSEFLEKHKFCEDTVFTYRLNIDHIVSCSSDNPCTYVMVEAGKKTLPASTFFHERVLTFSGYLTKGKYNFTINVSTFEGIRQFNITFDVLDRSHCLVRKNDPPLLTKKKVILTSTLALFLICFCTRTCIFPTALDNEEEEEDDDLQPIGRPFYHDEEPISTKRNVLLFKHPKKIEEWEQSHIKVLSTICIMKQHEISTACFSADEKLIFIAYNNQITAFDLFQNKCHYTLSCTLPLRGIRETTPQELEVRCLAHNKKEDRYLLSGHKQYVFMWDLQAQKAYRMPCEGVVLRTCFNHDGGIIAATSSARKLFLWKTSTRDPFKVIDLSNTDQAEEDSPFMGDFCWSPNDSEIAVPGSGAIHIFDMDGNVTKTFNVPNDNTYRRGQKVLQGIDWSSDGKWLVSGGECLLLWNYLLSTCFSLHNSPCSTVQFSPNSSFLMSSDGVWTSLWEISQRTRSSIFPEGKALLSPKNFMAIIGKQQISLWGMYDNF